MACLLFFRPFCNLGLRLNLNLEPERLPSLSRSVTACCGTPHLREDGKAKRGKHDPEELTAQDTQRLTSEELLRFKRGDDNRAEGSEITSVVKRCKESDAHSSVCHGIQEAVRRGAEKKVEVEPVSEGAGCIREQAPYNGPRQHRRKGERMGQAAMTQHMFIRDPEEESHRVDIWKDRAGNAQQPYALSLEWNTSRGP